MGLYLKRDEERSKLQEKIAADLRQKSLQSSDIKNEPTEVEDLEYLKGTKETTGLAAAWVLIIIAFVAVSIYLIVSFANR